MVKVPAKNHFLHHDISIFNKELLEKLYSLSLSRPGTTVKQILGTGMNILQQFGFNSLVQGIELPAVETSMFRLEEKYRF